MTNEHRPRQPHLFTALVLTLSLIWMPATLLAGCLGPSSDAPRRVAVTGPPPSPFPPGNPISQPTPTADVWGANPDAGGAADVTTNTWCGDGLCTEDESGLTCPYDCGSPCGDGACMEGETTADCPEDCGSLCGDGDCNGGESTANCAQDCGAICGDGVCNGIEVTSNCPDDCGAECGDGTCNGGENSVSCVQDCGASCGDGSCNGPESSESCPTDCGVLAPPPTGLGLNGYVDGVMDFEGGKVVQGWACEFQWAGSVTVDLYLNGPAGQGTFLKSTLANVPNESAVGDACQIQEGAHRYRIPLSPGELAEFAGQSIYVYGLSPSGDGDTLLTKSGDHAIPGGGNGGGADLEAPNLSQVTWLHTNVSGWPVTANLSSVSVDGGSICLNYDKANSWPSVSIPHSSGNGTVNVVANPWVITQYDGQWYGATWEWLAEGSTCKSKSAVAGDHIKQHPFGPANWKPASGETLFFMVSGLARIPGITNVSERSNLVKVVWP